MSTNRQILPLLYSTSKNGTPTTPLGQNAHYPMKIQLDLTRATSVSFSNFMVLHLKGEQKKSQKSVLFLCLNLQFGDREWVLVSKNYFLLFFGPWSKNERKI